MSITKNGAVTHNEDDLEPAEANTPIGVVGYIGITNGHLLRRSMNILYLLLPDLIKQNDGELGTIVVDYSSNEYRYQYPNVVRPFLAF